MKADARIEQMLEQLDLMRAHLIALKVSQADAEARRPELPWRNAGANGNFDTNPNIKFTGNDQ